MLWSRVASSVLWDYTRQQHKRAAWQAAPLLEFIRPSSLTNPLKFSLG
jgi:hypothetical protein